MQLFVSLKAGANENANFYASQSGLPNKEQIRKEDQIIAHYMLRAQYVSINERARLYFPKQKEHNHSKHVNHITMQIIHHNIGINYKFKQMPNLNLMCYFYLLVTLTTTIYLHSGNNNL